MMVLIVHAILTLRLVFQGHGTVSALQRRPEIKINILTYTKLEFGTSLGRNFF